MKETLLGILTGLACYAHGGEFTVKLMTETGRILADQWDWDIRVAVSNGTDSAIRIVERGGAAKETQLFFVLLPEDLMIYGRDYHKLKLPHTNFWEKISTTNSWSTKHVRTLTPGQTHLWDCSEAFSSIELIAENIPTIDQFGMYVQVLVGSNQWAYSNTNMVRFARQKTEDGNIIFTGTYTYRGTQPFNFNVYEHTTDGDSFLFCSFARVCKVPVGATPSFEVETGTDILKVTFSDNSPPVRFNISEGKVIP